MVLGGLLGPSENVFGRGEIKMYGLLGSRQRSMHCPYKDSDKKHIIQGIRA